MVGLWRSLRQCKLAQWALACVAFALLQDVDIVAQRFARPDMVERLLILPLAVGSFVALVLAWYHGERGAQHVTGSELPILALLPTSLVPHHFGQSVCALQVVEQGPTTDDAGLFICFLNPQRRDVQRLPQFAQFARKVGFAVLWDEYGPPDDCNNNAAGDYVCE